MNAISVNLVTYYDIESCSSYEVVMLIQKMAAYNNK